MVIPLKEIEDERLVAPLKPVLRIASQRDLDAVKRNAERKPEAMRLAVEQIQKHKLNMKLIDCDFAFDGAKVVFFYSAPSRVDFRELLKDLSAIFKMRIELRQIGIRDEIKMIAVWDPAEGSAAVRHICPISERFPLKWQSHRIYRSTRLKFRVCAED